MHRKKGSQKRDLGIWLLADPAQALCADSGHKGTVIPLAEGLGVLGPRVSLSCLLRLLVPSLTPSLLMKHVLRGIVLLPISVLGNVPLSQEPLCLAQFQTHQPPNHMLRLWILCQTTGPRPHPQGSLAPHEVWESDACSRAMPSHLGSLALRPLL